MELEPRVHYAADRWLTECFDKGFNFRVTEVYRTQERQNALYAQGRWKPGKIVTWTLTSYHTKRLACDIYPITGTYEEIAEIAAKYGIIHPLTFDKPHFEFHKVPAQTRNLSPEARKEALEKRLKRASPSGRSAIKNALQRLFLRKKRLTNT